MFLVRLEHSGLLTVICIECGSWQALCRDRSRDVSGQSSALPPSHRVAWDRRPSPGSWALLHPVSPGFFRAVAYPGSQFGFGSCRLLTKCLCFVRQGLEEQTARWLLPERPRRLGLLPRALRGGQSWGMDSSHGARSKEPRRQSGLLEDQTSVWRSGEGLRQEFKESGRFPDSQTLKKGLPTEWPQT